MTAADVAPTDHRLLAGVPDSLPISAVRAPQLSLLQWLIAAAAPRATHSAMSWAIARATTSQGAPVLRALGQPGLDRLPECLFPIAPSRDSTIEANVALLRDTDPSLVADTVAACWGGYPPGSWRLAVDRPRDWLAAYGAALTSAWTVGERRWQASQRALDREVARIGVAAVTGTMPVLLNSLHPRLSYRDGVIAFRTNCDQIFDLGQRRLALAPMLVPSRRIVVSFEHPEVAYIAYPALTQAHPTRRPGDKADRLAVILGPQRASAIRTLDQPRTMRALAAGIHCAASTTTYHCDHLERAGLVVRERRGSAVWVSRTSAGEQLFDLLA